MPVEEHEKTKTDIVDALRLEVTALKKELQHRKKLIAMQQQIIERGCDNYNKVLVAVSACVRAYMCFCHSFYVYSVV